MEPPAPPSTWCTRGRDPVSWRHKESLVPGAHVPLPTGWMLRGPERSLGCGPGQANPEDGSCRGLPGPTPFLAVFNSPRGPELLKIGRVA